MKQTNPNWDKSREDGIFLLRSAPFLVLVPVAVFAYLSGTSGTSMAFIAAGMLLILPVAAAVGGSFLLKKVQQATGIKTNAFRRTTFSVNPINSGPQQGIRGNKERAPSDEEAMWNDFIKNH